MLKPILEVTILYGSKGEGCQTECGIDWSSEANLKLAKERVKERFGDRVKLGYFNLLKTEPRSELKKLIKKEKLDLPALLINWQPRISGDFDVRMLLDVIDAELEIRRGL